MNKRNKYEQQKKTKIEQIRTDDDQCLEIYCKINFFDETTKRRRRRKKQEKTHHLYGISVDNKKN